MIIFLGVAGSGKSVQGRLLADRFGLPWLSTGEFLRMLVSGKKRKSMLEGHLIPDQEIINLVQKAFSLVDSSQEFVLDGFPRTATQADWLINQAKHGQLKITAIIHLKASESTVKERLNERGRPDDHEEAIKKRFSEYKEEILPIIKEFEKFNIAVIEVSAENTVEGIHDEIVEIVEPLIENNNVS